MNTLTLQQILPTGHTYSCLKWKNQQGRFVTSVIPDGVYSSLEIKSIPSAPPEYDGKDWVMDWISGKVGALGECLIFNTTSGHAEPGTYFKHPWGHVNVYTDDEHNGKMLTLLKNEWVDTTGLKATVPLPVGFTINDGIMSWQ